MIFKKVTIRVCRTIINVGDILTSSDEEYLKSEAGKALGGKTVAGAANGKEKQFHGIFGFIKMNYLKKKYNKKLIVQKIVAYIKNL